VPIVLGILDQSKCSNHRQWPIYGKHRVFFAEYQDEHNLGVAMGNLRRVVTVAGDEGLWDKVAAALGVSVGELKEKWIVGATANGEYNE